MDKPEALRLADEISKPWYRWQAQTEAAAELRRLVAENERLHQINQSHEMKLSVRGYEIQIEDLRLAHAELRKRNAELLEALKLMRRRFLDVNGDHGVWEQEATDAADAAIAKAEGEKT